MAKRSKPHVANATNNIERYTPSEYIEAAREVMGGIDLDPASCEVANLTVKATRFFDITTDGLTQPWEGRIWLNPPYARGLINRFVDKLREEFFVHKRVTEAIVLVNNATETPWFQNMAREASAICFPSSRIRFFEPVEGKNGAVESVRIKGSPLQAQAIFYFTRKGRVAFIDRFMEFGIVLGQT